VDVQPSLNQKKEKFMQEYYTAEEAMKVLNMTKTLFYRKVNDGDIPFEIDLGRKRGKRFPKIAIDFLAKLNKKERALPTKSPLSLTPSTVAELWNGLEITRQLYGSEYEAHEVSFETLMEWRSINPDIYMSLKEGDQLVGSVTFIPMEERIAKAVINGNLKEKDIPVRAIKKWTEPNISVYIPTIEVVPTGNIHRDRERGMYLLRHTIKWAVIMIIQHDIKNWYAIGATPDGKSILEALGFSKINDDTNGYALEGKKEPVKLIGMYLRGIEGKKTA